MEKETSLYTEAEKRAKEAEQLQAFMGLKSSAYQTRGSNPSKPNWQRGNL